MSDALFAPKIAEHVVLGQTIQFRPITVATAFKLKDVMRPLAQSVASLFSALAEVEKAKKSTHRSTKTTEGDTVQEIEDAQVDVRADVEGLRHRQELVQKVIDGFFDCLKEERHLDALCEAIFSSVRKDQPEHFKAAKDIKELPLPAIVGMVVGTFKANSEVLGPLAPRLEGLVGKKLTEAPGQPVETDGTSSSTQS